MSYLLNDFKLILTTNPLWSPRANIDLEPCLEIQLLSHTTEQYLEYQFYIMDLYQMSEEQNIKHLIYNLKAITIWTHYN